MARQAKLLLPDRRARRRRVSPLAVVSFLLIVFAASVVAWLALTYDPSQDPNRPRQEMAAAAADETVTEEAPGEEPATEAEVVAETKEKPPETKAEPTEAATEANSEPAPETAPETPPATAPEAPRTAGALTPAPVAALVNNSSFGSLPAIAPDGRTPLKVYARPYQPGDQPRLAIVLRGLGLSSEPTSAAIRQMPGAVTLAFSPYGYDLQKWSDQARADGHETLVELPMEPESFPIDDPGPLTLLVAASERANMEKMDWLLSRFTGYVGVINHMGSRFLASERDLRPVLMRLQRSGLMFVDTRETEASKVLALAAGVGLPRAYADQLIDRLPNRASIDKALQEAARVAREKGRAVAIGRPFPVTLERIEEFLGKLEQLGIELAPLSALADEQGDPA